MPCPSAPVGQNPPTLPHSRPILATRKRSIDPVGILIRLRHCEVTRMVRNMMARPTVRFVTDALAGLGMFFGVMTALMGPSAAAGLVAGVGEISGQARGVLMVSNHFTSHAATSLNDPRAILIVLAVVFSALFALNVAFIRHLRKAYATEPVKKTVYALPGDTNARITDSTL
jgi:hypothetical protein